MMLPPPPLLARTICRAAAWPRWNMPVRLTAMMRSQVSASSSRKLSRWLIPAHSSRISSRPNSRTAAATAASTAARSRTSSASAAARPPAARMRRGWLRPPRRRDRCRAPPRPRAPAPRRRRRRCRRPRPRSAPPCPRPAPCRPPVRPSRSLHRSRCRTEIALPARRAQHARAIQALVVISIGDMLAGWG